MTKLITAVAVMLAVAFAPCAFGQLGSGAVVFSNSVAAATSTNVLASVDVYGSANVAVQVWIPASAGVTNDVTLSFGYSLDGINWMAGQRSMYISNFGAAVNVLSNWNVGAVRHIRLTSINNATGVGDQAQPVKVTANKKKQL